MLKVVAAVYLLNFYGAGPTLVPFDTMAACQIAKERISRSLVDEKADTYKNLASRRLAAWLICVKSK